jgi:hypothetical protein
LGNQQIQLLWKLKNLTILSHNVQDWCCHLCSSCSTAILAYVGSQCTDFHAAGWMWDVLICYVLLFRVMHFVWCDFWQLIGCSSVSTSAGSFVRLPPMMQPLCPGLSLLMRAGLMVMTPRLSNSPPNEKVQTHQTDVHKELVLAGQPVTSA